MYIFIRFIATSEQGRIFACPASPTNKNGCKSTAIIRRISPLCKKKRRNISPVKDRILYYIENLSISKREFYSKTGISRGTLESPTGITEDTLAKFIATYPEVSLEWLIRGEGEIVRPNGPEEAPADLLEMARRVIEAKDEIIELQKNRIDWLTARLSEKG